MHLATELHCLLNVAGENVYRLADVSMIDESRINAKDHLEVGPALAIEIRCPEDRTKAILKKAEEYFASGTKLVWIVEVGEELTGGPIWPDLKVDLEAAFKGI